MAILNVLGLHTGDIDHAAEKVQEVLESLFLSEMYDTFEEELETQIPDYFAWDDATNSIIRCMFDIAEDILTKEYPTININFSVNGYDSNIYIYDLGKQAGILGSSSAEMKAPRPFICEKYISTV